MWAIKYVQVDRGGNAPWFTSVGVLLFADDGHALGGVSPPEMEGLWTVVVHEGHNEVYKTDLHPSDLFHDGSPRPHVAVEPVKEF